MAIRRAAGIVVALVSMIPGGPVAHAAAPVIEFKYSPSFTQLVGAAYVAGSTCQLTATGATPTQVAIAVQVTCSINGLAERSTAAPGDRTAASVVVATTPPVVICASGKAAFLETATGENEITMVTAGPQCILMPT
jgi:hypothetical protein